MENILKAVIYQSEIDFIGRCIADYPDIETGGDLFGFWTYSGYPVIQYAIGPGDRARRSSVFFQQDEQYLLETGLDLNMNHALQHVGEWHSHHRMGLAHPSGHDSSTVVKAINDNNLKQFFLVIGNITSRSVSLNGFMYYRDHGNQYSPIKWVVLDSYSPIRGDIDRILGNRITRPRTKISPKVDLDRTTLDSSVSYDKPNFANGSWLSTTEGKSELKQIYEHLNDRFDKVRMFLEDDQRVRIQCERGERAYHIVFPQDYPSKAPNIYLQQEEKSWNLTENAGQSQDVNHSIFSYIDHFTNQ